MQRHSVLDNMATDPSMVRERVAMAFFARLGQPASRESFARLYVNNVFQGLYAVVEAVDADFLARTLGERTGYLFERDFIAEYRGEDLGDDPTAYRSVFQPVNHELESDAVLYPPIRDLFHEANQPVDAVWRERVERFIDLAQLVTHVAIETFLSEADGMIGGSGMTNFYLYRRLDADRHRVIVWDKDRTFAAIDSPILQGAAENILFSRALAFADLRSLYLNTLDRSARLAMADSWLEREISRATSLIDASAHDDPVKPYANDAFEAAGEFLMQFARRRPAFVIEAVERERRER